MFDYKYMALGNRNYISSAEIMIENYKPVPVEQSSSFEKFFDNLKQIYGSGKEVRSESFKYWNHVWLNPSMILSQSSVSETDVKMVAPAVELVSYSSFRESLKYNKKNFNENYYVIPIETEGTNPKATMEAKYFISVFSEEKEAALTFLRCMEYDETVYSLMRHGVENVDYVKTEKGLELNVQIFIRNILNPDLEVKFAHDFPSWNDY
ncbi:MAG TPA: hypothetical protein DDZ89_21285 [Clostridiales bacterium]|nr:hypothetical protein [Clostridiales bacterium]